jgi:hypothetical protein
VDQFRDAKRHDRPDDARDPCSKPAAHNPLSRVSLGTLLLLAHHLATRLSLNSFHSLYTYYYGCAWGPGSSAARADLTRPPVRATNALYKGDDGNE